MAKQPKPKTYKTLEDLVDAFKDGALAPDDVLWLDNDTTFIYVGDEEKGETPRCVFRMDPGTLLDQALDLLGIPSEGV